MIFHSARLILCLLALVILSPTLAAATTVQVVGLEAADADLHVTLAWSEIHEVTAARLAVRDAKGTELTSLPIEAPLGETVMVEIPDVLSAVADGNLQFSLAILTDSDKLAAPLPFRIRFDCPKPDLCHFEVQPGLRLTDTIDLAPELAEAIDANPDQAVNLMALTKQRPELRGEAYSYAFDLEHSGTTEASTAGCTCAWTSVTDSYETSCGAYATLEDNAWSRSSIADADLDLRLELRCNQIEIPNRIAVSTPAGRIVISPPSLVPCAAPCIGTVAHGLTGGARVIAEAGFNALAEIDLTLDWEIDGQLTAAERLSLAIPLAAVGQGDNSVQFSPPLVYRPAPSNASANIHADAFAQRLNLYTSAIALGSFHTVGLAASGFAECALQQTADVHTSLFCRDKEIGLLSGDRP